MAGCFPRFVVGLQIVVGYGYASDSAANILQFAMLDVCDGSQIVVSTIDSSAVSYVSPCENVVQGMCMV